MPTTVLAQQLNIKRMDFLPIAARFCEKIGLAAEINAAVPTAMTVDVGTMVQFMVLDTLSGRSPLYRLAEFAENVDTGLLLGRQLPAKSFNDTTVGRTLDALFAAGTEPLFSRIAFRAAQAHAAILNFRHVNFDTTSVNVWGDYLAPAAAGEKAAAGTAITKKKAAATKAETGTLQITNGHSKDHRPDLKQFLLKMLCVNRTIPIVGGCENGNVSDQTINNRMLTKLSKYLAKHGIAEGAFVYITDAALITGPNLREVGKNLIISRIPFTFTETEQAVLEVVRRNTWQPVATGVVSSSARKAARYRVAETAGTIDGQPYRLIVVHSDAHDQRRQKKLARTLAASRAATEKQLRRAAKLEYYCRADATAAATALGRAMQPLHYGACRVEEKVTYARGRWAVGKERTVTKRRFVLVGEVVERAAEVAQTRLMAGCFVLITNTPVTGPMAHSSPEVFMAYKEQHGIERNFSFLKDPLFVNDLFLKNPDRIEVLGFILLTALLVWRLMEQVMRDYLNRVKTTVPGWDKKPTQTPTSFLMATKFKGVQTAEVNGVWFFAAPLTATQQAYVQALGLSEEWLLRRTPAPVPQAMAGGEGPHPQ